MKSLSVPLLAIIMAFAYYSMASGQSNEIADLVSHLSWSSIGMDCDVLGDICLEGAEAKQLVRIGKPATKALLTVLKDKEKAVATHVILTRSGNLRKRKALCGSECRLIHTRTTAWNGQLSLKETK